jgi:DNA polymerase-3 subunit delta
MRIHIPISLRWSDLDAYGHVNNAAMFGLLEEARIYAFWAGDDSYDGKPDGSAPATRIFRGGPDAGTITLAGQDLRPLGDEARSSSLFGGSRHIWVRANGDEAHDAVQFLIETAAAGAGEAAPVIIVATAATDKARTAKLLEKRKDALVAMFHPPDLAAVAQAVRGMADAAGLRLGGDLAERIARAAGLDVRLAQSEIDKLALYVGADPTAPRPATPDDHAAIGAATEEDGLAPLVNAVLGGELGKLAGEIRRMRELGLSPVGVALALERRAAQLAQIAAFLGPRGNFDAIDKGAELRLGIFFKEKRDIAGQFKRWTQPAARGGSETRLDRLIPRLAMLHRTLLANSQAAELLLAQELTGIARFAARR